MSRYFYIVADLEDKELEEKIFRLLNIINLERLAVIPTAYPDTGPFQLTPCQLFLHDHEDQLGEFRRAQQLYKEARCIHFGSDFQFHLKTEILEIPRGNFEKYLCRCLINLYLEFNKCQSGGFPDESPVTSS